MTQFQPALLAGAHTALITPFSRDGSTVDLSALEAQVLFQASGGVAGVVPCGTTGETPTLSDSERRSVIQTTVATAGPLGVKVIAGAGSNATAHAIELQSEAEGLGADASLQVVPYYNKPSQEGLFRHFMAIADAAEIPIVLYDVPGRSGVGLSVDTVVRLAAHPRIVAIKVANGSLGFVGDVAGRCDLEILSGDDPLTLPMQSLGAVGVISVLGNIAPGLVAQQIAAGNRGDLAAARVVHERVLPLATGLLSLDGNPVPIKAAMSMLGRDSGVVRPPLAAAGASVRDQLAELLDTVGVRGPAGAHDSAGYSGTTGNR